ncbi:Dna2/Cas4 domain-containing protein [Candidatus Woesearchaeota archaeon]|nr:MAG: Dna2/Cas4 domain-containing protein [Candidatus Woesearchaeota archaeon]
MHRTRTQNCFKGHLLSNIMLSVTNLATALYCKRKLFIEKVLRLKKIPKESLAKGKVRHAAYELVNKEDESIVRTIRKKTEFPELLLFYKKKHLQCLQNALLQHKGELKEVNLALPDVFKQSWPSLYRETKERAFHVFSFMEKHQVYGEELWQLLTPKIDSEVKIVSEELLLTGIIDQVWHYEDETIPYELKTGSAPLKGVWPSHSIQIGSYILMLQNIQENAKKGYVKYLDIQESREVFLNPFLEDKILATRDAVVTMIETRELPDRTSNKKKCDSCEFKAQCYDEKVMDAEMKKLQN